MYNAMYILSCRLQVAMRRICSRGSRIGPEDTVLPEIRIHGSRPFGPRLSRIRGRDAIHSGIVREFAGSWAIRSKGSEPETMASGLKGRRDQD